MRIKSRKPVSCSRTDQELCLAEFLGICLFRILLKEQFKGFEKFSETFYCSNNVHYKHCEPEL